VDTCASSSGGRLTTPYSMQSMHHPHESMYWVFCDAPSTIDHSRMWHGVEGLDTFCNVKRTVARRLSSIVARHLHHSGRFRDEHMVGCVQT
jgi:hypothetical protein